MGLDASMITVIILTYNEEKHIERCIKSLQKFAQDIIVIDSFSTDRTKAIAESYVVQFYQNPWVNHSVQLNWAIKNVPINTPWAMRVDADEYVTDQLAQEINEKVGGLEPSINGVYLKRRVYFMDRWIRHGGWYPQILLRIWRTGYGACEERWMDEHIILSGGPTVLFDRDFVDDNLNHLTWWIEKHNGYANREAVDLLNMKYGFFLKKQKFHYLTLLFST